MTAKSIFLHKPFWKKAMSLALPIAFQNLLSASFSMVDTVMVAGLGGTVLSAVGMATQFSWVINGIIFGIGSGTAIFVSQYWGAGDKKAIHRTEGMAALVALLITGIACITAFLFSEQIVGLYSKTPEIIACGASYLRYVCWSYIPIALIYVCCTVLRSTESVILPVILSGGTAILNVFLNYSLIFGKFGLPKMGAAGAALATSLSNWIMMIVMIIICIIQKNIIIAPLKDLFSFNGKFFREYLSKTFPTTLNETVWTLGTAMFNMILSNLGDDYYAGVTILRTLESLCLVFDIGLCNACCIIVGKNIGAGYIKEAKEDSIRFNYIMPLFGVLTGIILFLLKGEIVGLFTMNGNYTALAVEAGITCLAVYSFVFPVRNIPYLMIVGIFRPGGDAKTGMICDLVPIWFISMPVTAILAYWVKLPFEIVFICMYACEDIPKAIICIQYYLTDKWIRPVTDEGIKGFNKYKEAKILTKAK